MNGTTNPRDKELRHSRRLGFVPRWVVLPTVRKQSVAEHSYGVAQIALWLLQSHTEGNSTEFAHKVVVAALDHDNDEATTGDVPSTSKTPQHSHETPQEKVVVKTADLLEALVYLREEALLGNSYGVAPVSDWIFARLHEWWGCFEWAGPGRKPLTSDLLKNCLAQATPATHPSMEQDNE